MGHDMLMDHGVSAIISGGPSFAYMGFNGLVFMKRR